MCFLFISQSIAQEKDFIIPDSLKNKTYDYLFDKMRNNFRDTISSLVYINTALKKSIIENRKANLSYSTLLLSYYAIGKNEKFDLIKKSIKYAKLTRSSNTHLILPYHALGRYYYTNFEYDKALQEYIKVLNISKDIDRRYEHFALANIAELKGTIGKHKEALELYKKGLHYEMTSKFGGDSISITSYLVSLAESMRYNKIHDSASYYYKQIKKEISPFYTNKALINQGINLYQIGDYKKAKNLLNKGNNYIDLNDASNQKYHILAQFYLGKINQFDDFNSSKTKDYFLKVDSLFTKTNIALPETRETYEFLIEDYKRQGNLKAQLRIINKLIRFDSVISSRKIRTANSLFSKYDTPQLLKSKEAIIKSLKQKTNILSTRTFYLIVFIFLLFLLFIIQYNRHRKYKKRFNKIISELNTQKTKVIPHSNLSINPQLVSIIDEETIAMVLKKLDNFEAKKEFLQNDINLAMVAKKCDTNTKYLSKIIHTCKDKSFVNYINDLRINYILKELKENTILQKYTIKSISEEIGFNTAESFATAFRKKTGIRPSYYIKNLKNK
jgi:AraC-like DNA-binding protein